MVDLSSKTISELDEGTDKENMRMIEAALFVSGRFLKMADLVYYTDLNPIIIREVIQKLRERFDSIGSAIEIIEKKVSEGEMWKMDVRAEYSKLINKLATGSSEFAKAEQETLAIIAYKQPIKQSVIIKIRGNKAYDHIKKFKELGLIKKKRMGHTHELTLSDEFYDYFSIEKKGNSDTLLLKK
jgi:segregation and condensation protein B